MANIRLVIGRLRPFSEYHWLGGDETDYSNVGEWRDSSTSKPTLLECEDEWQVYLSEKAIADAIDQTQAAAKTTARNIPDWATWTQADFQAWYDANISPTQINAVTSLAEAKPILLKQSAAIEALAKMVIAMRNQLWPDLEGS